MRLITAALLAIVLMIPLSLSAAEEPSQSQLKPSSAVPSVYPKIVLYSVSWCPHCKEAKEYLTSHDIPFINRDVELDSDAMATLTDKYKSYAVPVIVIGDDEVILKGFDQKKFEQAVEKLKKK